MSFKQNAVYKSIKVVNPLSPQKGPEVLVTSLSRSQVSPSTTPPGKPVVHSLLTQPVLKKVVRGPGFLSVFFTVVSQELRDMLALSRNSLTPHYIN